MNGALITDTDLADQFGITVEELNVLRLRHHWPHVKLGRKHVRFTPEQVAEIVRRHSEKGASPSLSQPAATFAGQTKRSAARSR